MSRFEDDDRASCIQFFRDQIGDLMGHPFLNLGAARDFLDDSGQLAQAGHFSARKVADVGDSHEGKQVMLAHAVEADVAHEDDFIVPFLEDAVQMMGGIGAEAGKKFGVHPRDSFRGFQQALAVGVFPHRCQDFPDGSFNSRKIDAGGSRFGRGWIAAGAHFDSDLSILAADGV